jgi:hypothetical protein
MFGDAEGETGGRTEKREVVHAHPDTALLVRIRRIARHVLRAGYDATEHAVLWLLIHELVGLSPCESRPLDVVEEGQRHRMTRREVEAAAGRLERDGVYERGPDGLRLRPPDRWEISILPGTKGTLP